MIRRQYATHIKNLLRAGSKSMVVDGSSANKTYSYSPGSGSVLIEGLTCILDDPGAATFDKFGSIAGLTNGFDISVTIGGVTTVLANVKDNADLATCFYTSHFGSAADDGAASAIGFGDSHDVFIGNFKLGQYVLLIDTDSIQVVIKDDLSTLSTLQMACIVQKEV